MYRQILVKPEDADFQRIVWREDSKQPIQDFKLTTVTYGTSCAPHLAIRTLRQLAIDEKDRFPRASEIVLNSFYVDDVLTGTSSIKDAVKIKDELVSLLKCGGMRLRKWTSNDYEILKTIPIDDREIKFPLDIDANQVIKTLGIQWNPIKDSFGFKIKVSEDKDKLTKRRILSEIAKLFDPLGWLSPVVIKSKLLMQRIWVAKIDWDDAVPEDIASVWRRYKGQLHELEDITVPRRIGFIPNCTVQIHGFSDASEKAYAAVVYTRIVHENGCISVRLLATKSRVAPIKTQQLTIPKLELLGAHMLAVLMDKITTTLDIGKHKAFLWTDSTAVLGWINREPSSWQVFVANKVASIQS